jgi:hypothetical protein
VPKVLAVPRTSVYPSGAAFATASVPIEPPAPVRVSWMNGCASAAPTFSNTTRITASPEPPAGKVLMMRTGLSG